MGSTTLDAKQHFGHRILELLGRAGLSQTEAAERAGMPLRTLQGWIIRERPPGRVTSRLAIQRLEKVLGEKIVGTIADHGEGEMIYDGQRGYFIRDTRRGQMVDFRQQALHAAGRARHGVARAIERLLAGGTDPSEIVRMLENADGEIAATQRILMGKIELNDKGEPV